MCFERGRLQCPGSSWPPGCRDHVKTATLADALKVGSPGLALAWDGGIVVTNGTMPPFGIDTTVPTTARMYDYWLGGTDNFTADRVAALAVSEAAPEARLIAVENRKFLRRAVRYLTAEAGITQFLDIGTGMCASYCVPFKALRGLGFDVGGELV
jgi:hypothetical protein